MHSDFTLLAVDSSFFLLFDFPLLQGRQDKSLASDKIILSKEKALSLFGHTDVVGNLLSASTSDTTKVLIVSAVLDKASENSHLHFDALVHHSVFPNQSNGGGVTYGLLTTANAREPLMKKINSDTQRPGLVGEGKTKYFFHPLINSYFNTDNRMVYMKTRSPLFLTVGYVVCGLILFIATFNFINLLLLSWQNRRKETGIKKTLGVTWKGLMEFSIAEAAVYVFTGFLFSMAITFFTIPVFNSVFESNLSLECFSNTKVIGSLSALLFLITCLAVLLSASKQWSMRAINLMRRDVSGVRFSRLLFTAQFIISITFTICSVTIIQQMDYLAQAPLGFNRYMVQVDAPDERLANDLGALKQKVMQIPDVNNVTVTNGNPISGNAIVRYDLADEQFYTPYLFGGDEDYFRTLGLQLIDGQMPSEVIKGKLVNRTLVRLFNMDNPVGQKIPGTANDVIVGVVEDFTCGSFKQEIPPAIISIDAIAGVDLPARLATPPDMLRLLSHDWLTQAHPPQLPPLEAQGGGGGQPAATAQEAAARREMEIEAGGGDAVVRLVVRRRGHVELRRQRLDLVEHRAVVGHHLLRELLHACVRRLVDADLAVIDFALVRDGKHVHDVRVGPAAGRRIAHRGRRRRRGRRGRERVGGIRFVSG